MREIGTIAGEKEAKGLADYLLTLGITTKLEPRKAGGFSLWVHREERVPEARAVLAEFESNPADPRFVEAAKTAQEIRKKAEKVEKEYSKKVKNLRDRWEGSMYVRAPLAFALIVVSVLVTLLTAFNSGYDWAWGHLAFTTRYIDEDFQYHYTGFQAIRSGQVWRLITPIFIHVGLIHLLFNMMAMRYFGETIEMRKGTWRFVLIVVVSAIASNVGESYKTTDNFFGGMSGVLYALAGYLWIKGHTDPEDGLRLGEQAVKYMLGWFLLGILAPMSVPPNEPMPDVIFYHMANVAHGVGLAVGIIFGLMRF